MKKKWYLRWLLSIALRIPTAHNFRARTQQKKFPLAKFNSKINACFLLNGHGDLYFLLHNNSVHTFLLCLKKCKKECIKLLLCEANYHHENNDSTNAFNVHVALNSVMFPQILYDIVPYARHFLLDKFFPKYYSNFNKLCFELRQNVTWTDE